MKIGFIGLGHMGKPMVENLLKSKFDVTGFDVDIAAGLVVEKLGAKSAKDLSGAIKGMDVVITMLQKGNQVHQCCYEDNGIFKNLKAGALFIDCSTIDVETSRELHDAAKENGIAMLDAPVSGGVVAAEKAALTFMVGGEQVDFEKAKPVLGAMGKKIVLAGKAGSGAAAKICNNMLLAISMIGVCEAFNLAEKLGLDSQKLYEISSNASGQCWSLTSYCPAPNILSNVPSSHNYEAGFTAAMMLKDLNLSQQAADYSRTYTPLAKEAQALYERFNKAGHEQMDFSGIIKMLAAGETD